MISGPGRRVTLDDADVAVVGGGIVGLSVAAAALDRGARVVLLERDPWAVGASVRNFGHLCITAQAGLALDYALASRTTWLRWGRLAGFPVSEAGTVVVARAEDELEVLDDFAATRGEQVVLLAADEMKAAVPALGPQFGGARLPMDLRVDPRDAIPAITHWLVERGLHRYPATTVTAAYEGTVETTRGVVVADQVVVAVGHDLDRLDPEATARAGVHRCALHMLQVANPSPTPIDPAVLTGLSMLRYPGFAVSPARDRVRSRLALTDPEAIDAGLNLMLTQRPDGDLVIGDTHTTADPVDPFRSERLDALVLDRAAELLGVGHLQVRSRWQGVYASAAEPYLVASPEPGVRQVAVTSGIGMTTAPALAEAVLDQLTD